MEYHEKIRLFFKSKNISQKKAADILGVSPAIFGRYLSGVTAFPPIFIVKLVKEFPEIDLQYIFSENEDNKYSLVKEATHPYGMDNDEIVKELELIENKISKIRAELARKSPEE